MDEKLAAKVKELIERAEKYGKPSEKTRTKARDRDSLSQFIKTKEQADLFMKLLRSA